MQTGDVSAHRVEDVEVFYVAGSSTKETPIYCPEALSESLPGSSSENGPCLVDDGTALETSSGTSSGTSSETSTVYLPLIAQQDPSSTQSVSGFATDDGETDDIEINDGETDDGENDIDANPISTRLGFGFVTNGGRNDIEDYPELESLQAGWYLDWHARKYPPRPHGIEYVQMIHVHQKVTCGSHVSADRVACPYVVPYEYEVRPSLAKIAEIAQLNPGSTWLVGNEIERLDWGTDEGPGGQDEILPTLYPVAYHNIYNTLKDADPTAQVAIGGVIQPTPLRLQYLSIVWDTYQELYDEKMPVDIWNTHNFIMQEKQGDWGANIPVGVPIPPNGEGMYIGLGQMWKHIDMEIFSQQIRDFRLWMKDRGQQEKPLIVSEYGVLYPNRFLDLRDRDQASIHRFMLDTFDFFLNTKDCSLGYSADDCRLVQRWNWYSLNDHTPEFTTYARLYDPETKEMTEIGQEFRDYSQSNTQ